MSMSQVTEYAVRHIQNMDPSPSLLVKILYRILQDLLGSYRMLQDPVKSFRMLLKIVQDPV